MQLNPHLIRTLVSAICLIGVSLTPLHAQDKTATAAPEADNVAKIAASNPDATFLDQLATSGIPAAIGEMLSAQADAMGTLFTESAKSGTLNTDLIARKHIADKVSNTNQLLGRMLAVLDVGGKVYAGDYSEAAWSAGLTGLTELAGTQAGKGALAYVGCATTAPVTAAILAIQVYRESAKQVAETKGAVMLESLYGTVESMARDRSRKLGDGGDPFPVNPENVEKVWLRIISDSTFREKFARYVSDVLNRDDWPEPGFFDKMDAYIRDPSANSASGQSSTAAERIEATAQEKITADKESIKSYIAGLISTLNRAAKKEEDRVMAMKALEELKRFFKSNGASMEDGMAKMTTALKRIPEVVDWATRYNAKVDEAIKNKSTDTLSAERAMTTMYVRDVIRWIPATGKLGDERNKVYALLRAGYEKSLKGTEQINKERGEAIKNPPVPKEKFQQDPRSYYDSHFAKLIKPFKWDDSGGPDAAKAELQSYLESGQFLGPKDRIPMPEGRKPKANIIIEAWTKQNFAVAANGGDFEPGEVPDPDSKTTIKGYLEDLHNQISDKLSSINDVDEYARPALVAAATMAREAAGSMASLATCEHDETLQWMYALHQKYMDYSLQLWSRASDINADLSDFGCIGFGPDFSANSTGTAADFAQAAKRSKYQLAPKEKDDDTTYGFSIESMSPAIWQTDGKKTYGGKQVSLAEASALLSGPYSMSGIGKMSEQSGALLTDSVPGYMNAKAGDYSMVSAEIRRNYGNLAEAVKAHCDALETSAEVWDSIVDAAQTDITAIQKFVDPGFLNSDSFAYFKARRAATPSWVSGKRSGAAAMVPRSEQLASEWESDAFYMRRVGRMFLAWMNKAIEQGILGQSGSHDTVGSLSLGELRLDGNTAYYRLKPYPHYVTPGERSTLVAQVRGDWDSFGLGKFAKDKAPWLQQTVENYLTRLGEIKTYGEDNFLSATSDGTTMSAITASVLTKAEGILAKMQPGVRTFDQHYTSLITTLPLQIHFPGDVKKEKFLDLTTECMSAPLARRYVALRNKLRDLLKSHRAQAGQMAEAERQKAISEARSKLPSLLDQLSKRLKQGEDLIKKALELKNGEDVQGAVAKLNDYRTHLTDDPYQAAQSHRMVLFSVTADKDGQSKDALVVQAGTVINDIGRMSGRIAEAADNLTSRRDKPQDDSAAVQKFYEDFKKAYEYKNDARVMSFIGNNWSAGDGTSLMDLEEYLRNSFTVFDQIKYVLSNLKATKSGDKGYRVSYDLTITGKIFDTNITHEEKSSVVEEVTTDASGRMKITKTLDGKFWYVK